LSLTAYPPGPPSADSAMPSRTTFTSVLVLPTMTPSSFSAQEARAVCSLSWCSQVHPSNHESRVVVSSSRWAALYTSGALWVLVLPTMTPSSFSAQEARAVCSLSWCSQVHPSNHESREVVSSSRWAALSTSGALCVLVSLVLAVVPDSVVVPHAVIASVSTAAAASGVCSFMMRLSLVWNYLCQVRAWAAVVVVCIVV